MCIKEKSRRMICSAALLCLLLSACTAAPSVSGSTASVTPSAAEILTPSKEEAISAPAPAVEPTPTVLPSPPPLDFRAEPPLDELSSSIAVPDFLTRDQQELYRRAHCLYIHLFGSSTSLIDQLGEGQSRSGEEVVIGDRTYTISNGRYQKWEDFEALVNGIFTESFWEEHNTPISAVGEPWILFRGYNGLLCYLEAEKGQGYFYNENFPDEFRLDEQTENEISFTLIGHYSSVWPREGETSEERDARRKREYEYTKEFPIKLVLTEAGWRFDEFFSTLADE